jgi:hypothetical protein
MFRWTTILTLAVTALAADDPVTRGLLGLACLAVTLAGIVADVRAIRRMNRELAGELARE